jgi:hypothetical protein
LSSVRDELARESVDVAPEGGAWHALIASDPADLDEKVYIVIPEFSLALRFGPCKWQARSDTALPVRGNIALAIKSNRGEWWVVAWWPFDD